MLFFCNSIFNSIPFCYRFLTQTVTWSCWNHCWFWCFFMPLFCIWLFSRSGLVQWHVALARSSMCLVESEAKRTTTPSNDRWWPASLSSTMTRWGGQHGNNVSEDLALKAVFNFVLIAAIYWRLSLWSYLRKAMREFLEKLADIHLNLMINWN